MKERRRWTRRRRKKGMRSKDRISHHHKATLVCLNTPPSRPQVWPNEECVASNSSAPIINLQKRGVTHIHWGPSGELRLPDCVFVYPEVSLAPLTRNTLKEDQSQHGDTRRTRRLTHTRAYKRNFYTLPPPLS